LKAARRANYEQTAFALKQKLAFAFINLMDGFAFTQIARFILTNTSNRSYLDKSIVCFNI
jgi:hypothetical protein